MSIPVLRLKRPAEREPCPDCGAECAVGFVDGHRKFAHHLASGDAPNGKSSPLMGLYVAIGVVCGIVVDVLLARHLTDGGHSLFFISANTKNAQLVVVIVAACLLVEVAIAVSFVVVLALMLLTMLATLPFRLVRGKGKPSFHKLGTFVCEVKRKPLTVRYELTPTRDGIDWKFFPQSSGGPIDAFAIQLFAVDAGPALEDALALPATLRIYKPQSEHDRSHATTG